MYRTDLRGLFIYYELLYVPLLSALSMEHDRTTKLGHTTQLPWAQKFADLTMEMKEKRLSYCTCVSVVTTTLIEDWLVNLGRKILRN
jgi:hypothetical protein